MNEKLFNVEMKCGETVSARWTLTLKTKSLSTLCIKAGKNQAPRCLQSYRQMKMAHKKQQTTYKKVCSLFLPDMNSDEMNEQKNFIILYEFGVRWFPLQFSFLFSCYFGYLLSTSICSDGMNRTNAVFMLSKLVVVFIDAVLRHCYTFVTFTRVFFHPLRVFFLLFWIHIFFCGLMRMKSFLVFVCCKSVAACIYFVWTS